MSVATTWYKFHDCHVLAFTRKRSVLSSVADFAKVLIEFWNLKKCDYVCSWTRRCCVRQWKLSAWLTRSWQRRRLDTRIMRNVNWHAGYVKWTEVQGYIELFKKSQKVKGWITLVWWILSGESLGCQCDIREPTRWRLRVLFAMTTALMHDCRIRVCVVSNTCHAEWEDPQDSDRG